MIACYETWVGIPQIFPKSLEKDLYDNVENQSNKNLVPSKSLV